MDENKTNNQMNLNIIPQDNYGDNNVLNNPTNQNQNNTEKELLIKQLNEDLGLELTTSQINQNLNNNTNTIQKTTKTNYYNFHDNISRLSFISKIDDKKEDDKNNMEFDQDIFIPKTYDGFLHLQNLQLSCQLPQRGPMYLCGGLHRRRHLDGHPRASFRHQPGQAGGI